MLAFAQQQAPDTAGLTFTQGDMTALDIPALQQQPADMALVLLGTFSHLLENEQAVACMQSVGKHLKQGGLLVLELAHPGELRCCCWLLLPRCWAAQEDWQYWCIRFSAAWLTKHDRGSSRGGAMP